MFSIQPCVVLIEKWIASNDVVEENDNECHIVDSDEISEPNETDKESAQKSRSNTPRDASEESPREPLNHINVNNEINVIEDNSLPRQPSNDNLTSEAQQLIEESIVKLLQEIIRTSNSDGKTAMNVGRTTSETQSDIPSISVASSSQNSPVPAESVMCTDLLEDDIEQEQNKSLSETTQIPNKIPEGANASTANIFELGHFLYDELMKETSPSGVRDQNDNDTPHCDRAISEDRCQQNWPAIEHEISQNLPAHSQSNYDSVDQTDQRYNPECAECNQDLQYEYSQTQDEEADNGPIDYSMSMSYQHEFHDSVLDLSMKNSRSLTSPAAELRSGFGGHMRPDGRDFDFLKKVIVEERQKTSLHSTDPQIPKSAFKRLPAYEISQNFREVAPVVILDLSKASNPQNDATNGISESTSGTLLETVEACSQTETENADNVLADKHYLRSIVECNTMIACNLLYFLQSSMIQMSTSLISSNTTTPSTNQSSSLNCSSHDISIQRTSTQSTDTQTGSDSGGKKRRFSKRIRAKESEQREGASKTNNKNRIETESADNVAPKPPKRMKKTKNSQVENRFEVETIETSQTLPSGDNWLDTVPRKINFKSSRFTYAWAETPKRPSKYLRTAKSFL